MINQKDPLQHSLMFSAMLAIIPNPKNTGREAIPTCFGYHHIKLCGVSLSTAWGVREADTSIWHATPKN
jgi:hypothetical protein